MATIMYNLGERAFIEATLSGTTTLGSPTILPTPGDPWGVGLGTRVGGVGTNKGDRIAQILEVGTVTPAGYGRASLTRNHTGWPDAIKPGASYKSVAPQQSFVFSNSPSPNGATLWFIAGSAVVNDDNIVMGADTAATRTFNMGDTERVTPSYQQS